MLFYRTHFFPQHALTDVLDLWFDPYFEYVWKKGQNLSLGERFKLKRRATVGSEPDD